MTQQEYDKILKDILQKYNKRKPDIPARILEQSIDKILKIYADSYKKLFADLLEKLVDDFGVLASPSYQTQLATLQMIEKRMNEMNFLINAEVKAELEKSYVSAGAFHALATETIRAIEELHGAVPFSQLNTYKMEQLVEDTMEDLLFVTQHTSKELKKLVRDVFGKNLHFHGLTNESHKTIKKLIENELSKKMLSESLKKKGFVGIVDSKGRKWNLKTYVDMAVSTKMNQAYAEGLKDRAKETGKDLAVIPEKGATDSCSKFEGMLISLTGMTEGFMTYDQLKSTGLIFHPRCVHSPFPVGSLDLVPEEDIAFHNNKIRALKLETKKKNKKLSK